MERTEFNGMLSLAFEHHLTIGKNIPLDQVIEWLVSTAPRGLIEFVPKNDEKIKKINSGIYSDSYIYDYDSKRKSGIGIYYFDKNFFELPLNFIEVDFNPIISSSFMSWYPYIVS